MLSEEKLRLLKQLAAGIVAQFGPSCEAVIHDLTAEDLEHTLIHIENSIVSGRAAGDGPSRAVLESLRTGGSDHLAYLTKTPDGKILKSSTMCIRDENGMPEALFGINYDITALLAVENALHHLTAAAEEPHSEPERITNNVSDLLEELIERSCALIGKPVALMDREDKRRAVRFLNDSGALLITRSGDKIAKHFGISKFTLYSYLDNKEEQA